MKNLLVRPIFAINKIGGGRNLKAEGFETGGGDCCETKCCGDEAEGYGDVAVEGQGGIGGRHFLYLILVSFFPKIKLFLKIFYYFN